MICQKCNTQNKDDSTFCGKCGETLSAPSQSICNKCGFIVADGMLFCGKCGEKIVVEPPPPATCNKCGNEIGDGMLFCDKCGTKVGMGSTSTASQPAPVASKPEANPPPVISQPQPAPAPQPQVSSTYSMTITRESSVVGMVMNNTVTVNGIDYSLANGASQTISVSSQDVMLEVKVMMASPIKARLRLRNGVTAQVGFKSQYKLGIVNQKLVFTNITGADVLERSQ